MAERYPTTEWTINWSAVLTGFFVAVAVAILLGILLATVGLTITVTWALIIGIVSVLIGSFVTGMMTPGAALYNGLLVAVLNIVFTFVFALLLLGMVTLPGPMGRVEGVTFLIGFIVQLLAGAIGGLLGERSLFTTRRA